MLQNPKFVIVLLSIASVHTSQPCLRSRAPQLHSTVMCSHSLMAPWKSVKTGFEAFTPAWKTTTWCIYSHKIQHVTAEWLQLCYGVRALTFTRAIIFLIVPPGMGQHFSVFKLQSACLLNALIGNISCVYSMQQLPFKLGSERCKNVTVL